MKKVMVSVADYEIYRFLMPWKFVFSREKAFILSELEKMHPRFSGSCCYDTKYVLKKRQVMAEVVVMEKARLARYKTAGGELFLESEKKRSVFSNRARIVRILSIILILLAGFLSLRIAKSVMLEKTASTGISERIVSSEHEQMRAGDETGEISKKSVRSSEELLREVFSSVSRRSGKISAFSYEKNTLAAKRKMAGECTFSIHGCNSEEIANAQYCVVSFKDNEPHFELLLPFEDALSETENPIFAYEDELLSITETRKQLRDLGAIIEREHNGETSAEFSFVTDASRLYSCLKICGEHAEQSSWQTKKFSVTEADGKCRVQTSFSKGEKARSFNPILLCAQHAYLFGSELKVQKKQKKLLSPPDSSKSLVVREKLGEVRRDDGSVFVCYRTIDGKMTFEKKAL
ncbi:MAG: hypothetical protein IJ158_04130 [Treponema sp.]|nr:hypothetical protein [Treponema sp.]